jgi:hypothetical protein
MEKHIAPKGKAVYTGNGWVEMPNQVKQDNGWGGLFWFLAIISGILGLMAHLEIIVF